MEIINWIVTHPQTIIELYLALIGVASMIVTLTPTLKDDTVLKYIIKFVGKFIAINRK